uniref:Alpha-N-acetylglucosaminidase n=1 Tax=Eptatretus burgeri TaxID=7764 RepID=A0A8C4WWI4_EPTBU
MTIYRGDEKWRFLFYQNVCTPSYSFVWWSWKRWEYEIDWMALHGVNLALAYTGQEAIWRKVYLSLGMSQKEVDAHFAGPAFLAWARMGNLHSWAGPLPSTWHQQQHALQKKILQRMRSFGMIPVLPAFSGHVPAAIIRHFPGTNATRLGQWGHFDCNYSCSWLLAPKELLFQRIGIAYLREQQQQFGTDHIYGADTFNELQPPSVEPSYLRAMSQAVFKAMVAVDPQAIWMIQGWMIGHNPTFWGPEQVRALLSGAPRGRMLLLDLFAEARPVYPSTASFYGQPFIWCMLHNFGGNLGLQGAVEGVNLGPYLARTYTNSTMVGTGLTPEGIEQNEMIYELMTAVAWSHTPLDLDIWIREFTVQRYGRRNVDAELAWIALLHSVYNCTDGRENHNHSPLVHRPSLSQTKDLWYSPQDVFQAWELLLKAAATFNGSEIFRYDLVDVTRQAAQLLVLDLSQCAIAAYKEQNLTVLKTISHRLLVLLEDLDKLLGSHKAFLLGRWLSAAKAQATDAYEAQLYDYNARNQVTLWGPMGNILDYGNKQWAGLVADYYALRWKLFLEVLAYSLLHHKPFSRHSFNDAALDLGLNFLRNGRNYTTQPSGDAITLARQFYSKYRPERTRLTASTC